MGTLSFGKEFEPHASKPKRSRGVGGEGSDALSLPTKKEAEHVVNVVIQSLETTLLNNLQTDGFTLKLNSFGKFYVRHRPGIFRKIGFTGRPYKRRRGGRSSSSVWEHFAKGRGLTDREAAGEDLPVRMVAYLLDTQTTKVSDGDKCSGVQQHKQKMSLFGLRLCRSAPECKCKQAGAGHSTEMQLRGS